MDASELDALRVVLIPAVRTGIAVSLLIMIYGVALSLRAEDFIALKRAPLRILGGASIQLIGLPVLAMALVLILSPPPSVALGMFVVAACPGGNMSNFYTHLARGHVAYSVSLTAISSTLAVLILPLTTLALSLLYAPTRNLMEEINVDPVSFLVQLVILLGVPLAAGMLTRARAPKFADRAQRILTPVNLALLAGIILLGIGSNFGVFIAAFSVLFPLTVLFNAAAFALGYFAAAAMRFEGPKRRALTFEVGIQNAGLGLLIVLNQLEGLGGAAGVVAYWSIWHLIAGALLAGGFRLWDRRQSSQGRSAP